MSMNLHCDDTFDRDEGWFAANVLKRNFLRDHADARLVCLELGVGYNTPGIIKYPFWQIVRKNMSATYVVMNMALPRVPSDIAERTVWLTGDIGERLGRLNVRP